MESDDFTRMKENTDVSQRKSRRTVTAKSQVRLPVRRKSKFGRIGYPSLFWHRKLETTELSDKSIFFDVNLARGKMRRSFCSESAIWGSCQVLMESDDFTSMEGRVRVAHWKRQPLLTAEIAGSSPGIVGKNIVGFVTRLYFGTESQ